MNPTFFSSARMILLECHESLAFEHNTIRIVYKHIAHLLKGSQNSLYYIMGTHDQCKPNMLTSMLVNNLSGLSVCFSFFF